MTTAAASADTDLDTLLAALADPQRRRALELLHDRPHASGELARALAVAPPAMSRHLKVLRTSGLVEEEPAGPDARIRRYRLRPQAVRPLADWVAQLEAAWSHELSAFKVHVERTG